MDDHGVASITEINQGDTVADMMRYVHLDVESFQQSYAQLVTAKIEKHEQQSVLDELQNGLDGYTYLEEL
jgi:arginine decarboxylase